jgi:hypothetical protein
MNIDLRLLETQAKRVRLPKYIFQKTTFLCSEFFLLTDWTGIVPTNDNIPPDLLQVLKYPFPFPTPAPLPPSDILYARPIPRDIQNILATVRLIASTSELRGEGKSMEVSPPLPAPPPAPNVGSSCSFNQPSESTGSLFMSLYRPYEPYVEVSKAMIDQQEDRDVAHELPQVKKMDPYEEGKLV